MHWSLGLPSDTFETLVPLETLKPLETVNNVTDGNTLKPLGASGSFENVGFVEKLRDLWGTLRAV